MRTSPAGIALLHHWEGLRLVAYPDPGTGGAPWTIGWGDTGPDVVQGLVITRAEADARFARRLEREFEPAVLAAVKVPLEQHQFDALVSLAYNIGVGAFRRSSLVRRLNAGDYAGARDEFARWNRAGGRVMLGLARRRAAEAALFDGKPLHEAIRIGEAVQLGAAPAPVRPAPAPAARPAAPPAARPEPAPAAAPPAAPQPVPPWADAPLPPAPESPPPPTPPQERRMPILGLPASIILGIGAELAKALPALARLFAPGNNGAAVTADVVSKAVDVVTTAVGAANPVEALQRVQADPAAAAAADKAVRAEFLTLVELGGGVEGARAFALQASGDSAYGQAVWKIVYLVTASALFFLLLANLIAGAAWIVAVQTGNDAAIATANQFLAQVITADIGAALTAFGFWLGSSWGSKREEEKT